MVLCRGGVWSSEGAEKLCVYTSVKLECESVVKVSVRGYFRSHATLYTKCVEKIDGTENQVVKVRIEYKKLIY